jgi:hypothetical protein
MQTETRTYVGQTVTQSFAGFMGLRIDQRYTGVPQEDGALLVAAVGAPIGTGIRVISEEWRKWFKN